MAGFKTHVSVSSVLGIGYGAAAYGYFHLPPSTCILAAGLCGVSGMLPDLDSGPGRPLHESCNFAAAAVPMLLIDHFEAWGLNHEMMVIAGAAIYFLLRFGLPELLKKLTEHRGMFHSLPMALIFGELAFLLSSGSDERLRLFKAGGVVLGFLSHLILDEIWSVEFFSKHPGLKKSFGTAFKIFGKGWAPNLLTFALLGLITSNIVSNFPRPILGKIRKIPSQSRNPSRIGSIRGDSRTSFQPVLLKEYFPLCIPLQALPDRR
jgi:hypothetical protein